MVPRDGQSRKMETERGNERENDRERGGLRKGEGTDINRGPVDFLASPCWSTATKNMALVA